MTAGRPFCAAVSSTSGETLTATASRIDHWILLEYREPWARDAPRANVLSPGLVIHLRAQLAALPHSRLLFVKQSERRRQGRRVLFGSSRPGEERFFELEVECDDELGALEVAAALSDGGGRGRPVEHPLFLVCTHGKHDRCCARHGRPLYDALRHETDPDHVWQATHVGGDRFAGNVVVLPHGIYYGRVDPPHLARLLAAVGAGNVDIDHYRGRSSYSFPVQAAEQALRESRGLLGIGDLSLVDATQRADETWSVRFRTPTGAVHEVDVATPADDEPRYLTCAASEPQRARRHVATVRS